MVNGIVCMSQENLKKKQIFEVEGEKPSGIKLLYNFIIQGF